MKSKKIWNCNFAAWRRTFLCAVSFAAPEGAPLWRQQVCMLWADVGSAGRRGALVNGKLMFQHLTITHNIIHLKEITSLFLLHIYLPGTGCQICVAGGQDQVLSGPQDASSLPGLNCPGGRWWLLWALPEPLPHHLAGVCAFYQSEEGANIYAL